jgi:hypothetical protein
MWIAICKFRCGVPHISCKRTALRFLPLAFLLLILQPKMMAGQAAAPGVAAQQEVIGRLAGDDVSVTGAVGFQNENGRTTALLASGSDLTLRSGQAKIDLQQGGEIILCGPAHLSILKSGAAITIALDYGQVHLQAGAAAQITVYTALAIVTPQAIGDRERDLTVGLDQNGELCVTALSGAMRIEQQLTGESVIVPQGGDVEIDGGDFRTLRRGSRKCSCDLLVSQNTPPAQVAPSAPAPRAAAPPAATPAPEPAASPTYRIVMPLTYNASASAAPALTAEAIRVIRESVENPQLRFHGAVRPSLPPLRQVSSAASRPRNAKPGLLARFFGIFRHRRRPASEESAAARP